MPLLRLPKSRLSRKAANGPDGQRLTCSKALCAERCFGSIMLKLKNIDILKVVAVVLVNYINIFQIMKYCMHVQSSGAAISKLCMRQARGIQHEPDPDLDMPDATAEPPSQIPRLIMIL